MAQERRIDWLMFGIAAALALFGAMMVYSASAMFSLKETDSSSQYTYFFKQIGFTIAGLVAMYVVSRIDYHTYQRPWVIFTVVGVMVLVVLSVCGLSAINGVRWGVRF